MSERAVPAWRRLLAETLLGGRFALSVPVAGAVALLAWPLVSGDPYWIRELSLIAVLALVISGLNLSFGYVGALQFGHVFAFALGCYLTTVLAIGGFNDVLALVVIGGLAAAAAGAAIALPALRVGGWSLAITSLFLVVTIPDLVAISSGLTGGLNGLIDIPAPRLFGRTLDRTGLYEVTMVVAITWFALYRNLVTSRYGVMLRTLRESPELASSLGLSPVRLSIAGYAVGAFPAGMAGCLFGFVSLVVTPSQFGLTLAIGLVAASILGGSESVYGAIVGAVIVQLGPERSLRFDEYAPIAYGVFLIVAAIAFRSGLGGLGHGIARRVSRLLARPPSPGAAPGAVELAPMRGVPLRVSSLSKAFAGVKALNGVSLSASPGAVTAVIGANGSGKTTLLNVICGFETPGEGAVALGGLNITGLAAHDVARAGVARTFQTSTLPRGLSALDVVASGRFAADRPGVASCMVRLPGYRRSRRAGRREALAMLDAVGLRHIADEPATTLSLGTRRLVEVARALCANPRVLLLDEPATGLGAPEAERLRLVLEAAARAGVTVLLIEHDLAFVRKVADVAHVLDFGTLVASGPAAAIVKDPAIADPPVSREARSSVRDDAMLDIRELAAGYGDRAVVRDLSLRLPRGTVEALVGRNGAGKSTLLAAIAGQIALRAGVIRVGGRDVGRLPAHRRAAAGIAFVPEGKRIFRERTIRENIVLGTFPLALSRRERARRCDEVLAQFPVLQERETELAGDLSGGQQQMLAIGQAIAARPKLLLLDEPSAGLALPVVVEVFQSIRELSDDGLTVLLVEHRVPEALAIADHVTVLDDGSIGSPREGHALQKA